jgi:hypothetical protein
MQTSYRASVFAAIELLALSFRFVSPLKKAAGALPLINAEHSCRSLAVK